MLRPPACLASASKRIRLGCGPVPFICRAIRYASDEATITAPEKTTPMSGITVQPAGPLRREVNTIRTYPPRTPGQRHLKRAVNAHLWKGQPFRKLTFVKKGHAKGGRNSTGRVVVRHRGGGHRRRIRTVDFVRMAGGPHRVERIEYDPNRSAHLALLSALKSGDKSYIIAAEGMRSGDIVESFRSGIPLAIRESMGETFDAGLLATKTALRGNCLPVHMIPIGTQIYNVGSQPKKGAVFCRSAGTFAMIVAKEEVGTKVRSVTVRLQSGEIRTVAPEACATVGAASNPFHHFEQLGKAGRSRWKNIRPTVRGVAMNASDHPHGGGRGKSKGNVHPRSIWGTLAKGGYKTRKKRNPNKYLVKDRPRLQGKRPNKNK